MTEILPQYNEDGTEVLSFFNSWRGDIPQTIENAENTGNVDTPIAPTGSLIPLFLNDEQFTELLSAVYVGAEFAYPEKYLQIIWYLLSAVQLPVTMPEDCYNFPPSSTFIGYPLQNPYTQPDLIPEGYLAVPMTLVTSENNDDYPQNELGDIVVNFGAITLDADWFDELDGQLPTITIRVEGEGTADIKLINQAQGGLAIITLDEPPDLVDILAGIITGADNIIDVNLDNVSFPPETATEHIFPLEIEGEGEHTIYIVFLPIIDDSLIPLRFGGGFRGVELCGFGSVPTMDFVDEVRYNFGTQWLQYHKSGEWFDVADWNVVTEDIANAQADADEALADAATALSRAIDAEDLAIIAFDLADAAQAAADAAQAAADAAQSAADSAIAVNVSQQTELEDHEARIAALEADIDEDSIWSQEFDFEVSEADWDNGVSWLSGSGWLLNNGNQGINYANSLNIYDARITYVEVVLSRASGSGFASWLSEFPVTENSQNIRIPGTVGALLTNWMQINPLQNQYAPEIQIAIPSGHSIYIHKLTIWGRGTNPF